MVKALLLLYKVRTLRFLGVEIDVLEKTSEKNLGSIDVDQIDKAYDKLMEVAERVLAEVRSKKTYYVAEVRLYNDKGEEIAVYGEAMGGNSEAVKLFPAPVKLKRIGIVKKDVAKQSKFSHALVNWITMKEDVYVYEGNVKMDENIEFLILETENGSTIVYRQPIQALAVKRS
ncbi:MAG TPA: hypothetical protein EYP08_06170 [Pyrodictiaceae archaeon]|nr:hypothetical protein [Pyrodictiaceae archaeon]HIQ55750.1 hypothetical protein [Pyrodictium sp.]